MFGDIRFPEPHVVVLFTQNVCSQSSEPYLIFPSRRELRLTQILSHHNQYIIITVSNKHSYLSMWKHRWFWSSAEPCSTFAGSSEAGDKKHSPNCYCHFFTEVCNINKTKTNLCLRMGCGWTGITLHSTGSLVFQLGNRAHPSWPAKIEEAFSISLKSPRLYPFLDLYFSSGNKVEQSCTINYPEKLQENSILTVLASC